MTQVTGEDVRALRADLGLSQTRLAEKLGLASNRRQVARWEDGTTTVPGPVAILVRLLQADPTALDIIEEVQ